MAKIDEVRELERLGILGPEQCPEPRFWRWSIEKPELLPEKFQEEFEELGEIRWYPG